jgi:hypothetical protein
VRDPRLEPIDVHRHPVHDVDPLEAVARLDRQPAVRRRRKDEPGLAHPAPEQLGEGLRLAHREARPEREHLDEQRGRDDLVAAAGDPPPGLVDVLGIKVGERVRREIPVTLEEGAHVLGRCMRVEVDLGHERGRGHGFLQC